MLTLGTETALRPYRDAFQGMPIGAVVVERALPADFVRALRARLDEEPFASFHLADRGRYEVLEDIAEPDLLSGLRDLGSYLSGERLAITSARCLRLRRGDYALRRDDERTRPAQGRYELICDLSASSSGEAQVVYSRGNRTIFAAPQLTGSVSFVYRVGVSRYDRYLNLHTEGRVIHRLRLWLARIGVDETEPPPR
jgi:hypothetical protein